MKCRKCHKPMEFLDNLNKFTAALLPTAEEQIRVMEHQLVLCEHCEQPYGYLVKRGKLTLVMMTPRWLASRTPAERKSIEASVSDLKHALKVMKLTDSWVRRMEAIT